MSDSTYTKRRTSRADKPLAWLHGEVKTPPFTGDTTMNDAKRRRLEAKGWRVAGAQELLALSAAEAAFIEFKLKLAQGLRAKRLKRGLGQTQVAKIIHSSQSRVAKMEAGDPSVSLDLLVRSHLALGASNPELGRIIAGPVARAR